LLWTVGIGLFVGLLWAGWSFRAGNAATIDLDLIWLQLSGVAIWRVILVSIGLGAITGGTLVGFPWLRARLLNHRYRRAIRRLEAEVHELRSLPLEASRSDLPPPPPIAAAGEQR
jgi:hypothetical protein